MNVDAIIQYINSYGYIIVFLFLFLGIVGIPAPEESLLFLAGVLIGQNTLSLGPTILFAFLGTYTGMIVAYFIGGYIGYPFIHKYGRYVGITNERWKKGKQKYMKSARKAILIGFYIPGLRQINPYLAGIAKIGTQKYILYALLGSLLWTLSSILAGFYLGQVFNINPGYIPYLGILFLIVFMIYISHKYFKKKRNYSR